MGQVYNPATGLLGNYASQGPATAQGVGQNAQALMSPYTQHVIDPTLAAGQQQLALAKQQHRRAGQQCRGVWRQPAWASRRAWPTRRRRCGTQQQIGNMLNQGWGQALGAGTNIGLQAGQQGHERQHGVGQPATGWLRRQPADGRQHHEQNLNRGHERGGATADRRLRASRRRWLGQTNALNQAGTRQQQYQQNILNSQQAAFAQQQAFPYQQLQTLLGAISACPTAPSSTGYYNENTPYYSNPYGQAIGGMAALGGLAGGVGCMFNSVNRTGA